MGFRECSFIFVSQNLCSLYNLRDLQFWGFLRIGKVLAIHSCFVVENWVLRGGLAEKVEEMEET